jgi:hypothetical protein
MHSQHKQQRQDHRHQVAEEVKGFDLEKQRRARLERQRHQAADEVKDFDSEKQRRACLECHRHQAAEEEVEDFDLDDEAGTSKHYCVDVGGEVAYEVGDKPEHGVLQAIALKSKVWPQRAHIRISFMGGTEYQRNLVRTVVTQTYVPLINLQLEFVDQGGDVRVSFDPEQGAYSFLGTDALHIDPKKATMNLGFLDDPPDVGEPCCYGVIKHEFGHSLGALLHEHQNPKGGIEWNKDVVERELRREPNRWTKRQVQTNMFDRYSHDEIAGTEYDPLSIMHYFYPKSWVKGKSKNLSSGPNQELSEQDKYFLRLQYPEMVTLPQQMVNKNLNPAEFYEGLLIRTDDAYAKSSGKSAKQSKEENHSLSDLQVVLIVLATMLIMGFIGYRTGKSKCRTTF